MNYLFLIIVLVIVLGVLGIAMFTDFELDDEHYDRLKWIVIRWAYLVTFIGLIAKTFDIPYGIETVTIVGGIGAMLAGLLGISNKQYESRQVSEDEYDDEDYEEDDDEGEE
ncbi:MAG: phage holin [Acutalibacteraceae bacterium]|nr:phage holin [Acutalibacteraceae bacterium]